MTPKGINVIYQSRQLHLNQNKEYHSPNLNSPTGENKLNKEASSDAAIIQNSPIGLRPTLSPNILTTTRMTTTMTQNPTTATTTGVAAGTNTNQTAAQRITTAINKALRRNPESGSGRPGAPGRPGGP